MFPFIIRGPKTDHAAFPAGLLERLRAKQAATAAAAAAASTPPSTTSSHPTAWSDSPFSKKLTGTFGQNAGSVTKRMFDSLFPKDSTPIADDNFTLASSGPKFPDPSEPIYTDPSLFDLERSRSLRSIALSTRNQRGHGDP